MTRLNLHPELRKNEIFLTNSTKKDFELIGYSSKRLGLIAYDINNNVIPKINSLYPVFIKANN